MINNIEKFEGSFSREESGCTIMLNQTIQFIKDVDVLGLYVYLLTKPNDWKINTKELMRHFTKCKDKIHGLLNALIDLGLLKREVSREVGRFSKPTYKLFLKTQASIDFPPQAILPAPVPPAPVKPPLYKTKRSSLQNKEGKKIKTYGPSSRGPNIKNISSYKEDELFMRFYKSYPVKEKPSIAYKAFKKLNPDAALVERMVEDIQTRLSNNWLNLGKQFIPFPATYLNSSHWEGEYFLRKEKPDYVQDKQESIEREKKAQQEKVDEINAALKFKQIQLMASLKLTEKDLTDANNYRQWKKSGNKVLCEYIKCPNERNRLEGICNQLSDYYNSDAA